MQPRPVSRRYFSVHPFILLELPSEDEIAVTEEKQNIEEPCLIRKTIRYRNGAKVVLIQDFDNRVFHVEVDCEEHPFFFSGKQILKI